MAADRLTALDATFLELEEADQSAHMHIGAVITLAPGPAPSPADVGADLDSRLDAPMQEVGPTRNCCQLVLEIVCDRRQTEVVDDRTSRLVTSAVLRSIERFASLPPARPIVDERRC